MLDKDGLVEKNFFYSIGDLANTIWTIWVLLHFWEIATCFSNLEIGCLAIIFKWKTLLLKKKANKQTKTNKVA